MKKFELTLSFLKLPLDYLMLILAGWTAYYLRFSDLVRAWRPILFEQNLTPKKYWPLILLVSLGWLGILALNGLYHTNSNRKLLQDLKRVFFASATGFAGIIAYIFFALQKFDSRFLVLAGAILAFIFVSLERTSIKGLKIFLYKKGYGLRRVVIIGEGKITEEIIDSLNNRPALGYKIIDVYNNFNDRAKAEIIEQKVEEIIFTMPKAHEKEALDAVDFALSNHLTFKYSADLFATITSNVFINTIAGVPIVELRQTRLYGWGSVAKRLCDIFGSLILIIITSPFYLICALGVFLETGLPIIYKNERVGQHGKNFFTLKFRSMHQKDSTGFQFGESGQIALKKEQELIKTNSIKQGPVYKIKNDPRITKFGKFIRRWSLDELPQFFNVLKGEMSLVGPRPHQPREVEKYEKHHQQILAIKPGITGLAQISGRSNLEFEEEAQLDIFYIENWSLLTDLIILIKTPFIVIKKTGAM